MGKVPVRDKLLIDHSPSLLHVDRNARMSRSSYTESVLSIPCGISDTVPRSSSSMAGLLIGNLITDRKFKSLATPDN